MKGFAPHDHQKCVQDGLAQAEAICAMRKVSFTPPRRRALELLLEKHHAMGAYAVLERFNDEGLGDKPPVAYRALSFLVEQGLAHRIEHLNAYVACSAPDREHEPVFFICQTCRKVSEAVDAGQVLAPFAANEGFDLRHLQLEAQGFCPSCANASKNEGQA